MAEGAGRADRRVDVEALATMLATIGYPTRLRLLQALKAPHTLSEILVPPTRAPDGVRETHYAAKQTVQRHLDRLVSSGLVRVDVASRSGRDVPSYVLVPPRVYGFIEDLRRLAASYAGTGAGPDETGTLAAQRPRRGSGGFVMVLVHGLYEGREYPIASAGAAGEWVIGRALDVDIVLDYDPFVTGRNSLITCDGHEYFVQDLGSKNGTHVNWEEVQLGGSRRLRSGDVVGVGRSLLVFRGQQSPADAPGT